MRYHQFLTEKRKNNIIVVDIQPMYESYFKSRINIYEFIEFLKEQGKILYYYNGPDTVGSDTKKDIINWLYEKSDYDEDLYNKLVSNDVIWYDKGYAFFRGWMDNGADHAFIKKALRFMMEKRANDSRDIPVEEWEEKFPDDWRDEFIYDMIYLPDIPLNKLKQFSGSYLVGGGENECLAEVEILMSAFNIKGRKVKKFIY